MDLKVSDSECMVANKVIRHHLKESAQNVTAFQQAIAQLPFNGLDDTTINDKMKQLNAELTIVNQMLDQLLDSFGYIASEFIRQLDEADSFLY